MSKLNRRSRCLMSACWLALLCLWSAGAALAQTPPVEVEPYVYPYSLGGQTVVQYPDSLDYWENAPANDYGLLAFQGICYNDFDNTVTITTALIWPTNTMPLMFRTNYGTWTYKHLSDGTWTCSGTQVDGTSFTNLVTGPPFCWNQSQYKQQTGHEDTEAFELPNGSFVDVITTTTNGAKVKLYTGISTDTTRSHLIRLNVKVWNTTDSANETLISPSAVRLLTLTPDANNNVFIVRADEVREDVTPTLVGVADNDIKFEVTPERLKIRFYAQAGKMTQGYDPRPVNPKQDHWTSVTEGGSNEVAEIQIPAEWALPQIELRTTGPIAVTQTTGFTNQTTLLTILASCGVGAEAYIDAVDKTTGITLARLNVLILPLRNVPVGIFRVTDPASPATALGATDSNEAIIAELNQIFRQAGVQFYDNTANIAGGAYVDGLSLNYDKQPKDGILQPLAAQELDVLKQWVQNNVQGNCLPILFLRKEDQRYPDARIPTEIASYRGRGLSNPERVHVYSEPSQGAQALVAAHEVGHYFSLHDHWVYNPFTPADRDKELPNDAGAVVEHLMRRGNPILLDPTFNPALVGSWHVPTPGRWLDYESWSIVNGNAATLP